MSRFTKKMLLILLVFTAIQYVLMDLVLRISINSLIIIEEDTPLWPRAMLILVLGAVNTLVTLLITAHFTKSLRKRGLSSYPPDEFRFYRNLTLIYMVPPVLYGSFLWHYSIPHYQAALREGNHKIHIMNYSQAHKEELMRVLQNRYEGLMSWEQGCIIAGILVQWVMLFLGARRLIGVYQKSGGQPFRRR